METMERKRPRPRRSLTQGFKPEMVEHCSRSDRSIRKVARYFDLTETVRDRVTQADHDIGWSTSGDDSRGFVTHEYVRVSSNGG